MAQAGAGDGEVLEKPVLCVADGVMVKVHAGELETETITEVEGEAPWDREGEGVPDGVIVGEGVGG